jgi:hypothetical protein
VLALAGALLCAGVVALLAFAWSGRHDGAGPGKNNGAKPPGYAGGKLAAARLRLLVPAYFYPAEAGLKQWDQLIESARQAPVVAIVNPSSGPGTRTDPAYEKVIGRAREAGAVPIGYVSTGYAKRPLQEVKADMDRWYRLYPRVEGFFLDEQSDVADRVDYYEALLRHARKDRPNTLVVGNPGGFCAEEYVSRPTADVFCLAEHDQARELSLPVWVGRQAPDRIAAFLFSVPNEERMRELVQELLRNRVGYIYLTDSTQPNPWERLPVWWAAEVAAVRAANQEKE